VPPGQAGTLAFFLLLAACTSADSGRARIQLAAGEEKDIPRLERARTTSSRGRGSGPARTTFT